jgi:hypothetical protein
MLAAYENSCFPDMLAACENSCFPDMLAACENSCFPDMLAAYENSRFPDMLAAYENPASLICLLHTVTGLLLISIVNNTTHDSMPCKISTAENIF